MARSHHNPWRPASPPREHTYPEHWVSLGAVRAQDTSERGTKGKERDWDRDSIAARSGSGSTTRIHQSPDPNLSVTLGATANRRTRPPPPFSSRISRPRSTRGQTWTSRLAQVRGCAACCAARFALTRREGVTPPHAHRRKRYHFQGGGLGCLGRMGETRPFTGPRDTLCRHDHPVNGAYRRLTPTRPNLVY